ncbi:FixH family protein [Peribacillus saganii]|nr:FixH family protein [Peribacillus saganii]
MKKILFLFLSLLFVITGCSKEENSPAQKDELPELIEVVINLPEKADPNKSVTIKASVTQGDEKVTDADEVKFEIGKAGQENTEMIEAKHQGKGVYTIDYIFKEDGKYMVVAHVTARSMHNMPEKEITVGTGRNTAAKEENQQIQSDGNSANEGTVHAHGNEKTKRSHDHKHGNIAIDFQIDDAIKAHEEAVLIANIQNAGQPLIGADVRFELWQDSQEAHEFVAAREGINGEYSVSKTFTATGVYNIKIHLEKEDIHEHQDEKIDVK